ncbi:MAG: hypothetical protein WCF23_04275 [Candidatus Nitrosopolaris sp.]
MYKLLRIISRKLEANNKYNKIIHYEDFVMTISETEVPIRIVATTCGCNKKNKRKVMYQSTDIISAEIEACERLLKYASDEADNKTIESEIA